MEMNEELKERARIVETQTRETGDHFHGHHYAWEMAIVARLGDCTLLVWASDRGEEPHFHVIRGRDLLTPDFEACLKIQSAETCPHGEGCDDRLTAEQLDRLVELLQSKDPYSVGEQTVWQSLIGIWNRNNEGWPVPLQTAMPDYRQVVQTS